MQSFYLFEDLLCGDDPPYSFCSEALFKRLKEGAPERYRLISKHRDFTQVARRCGDMNDRLRLNSANMA